MRVERESSAVRYSLAGQQRKFNDRTDGETQRHKNRSIVVFYRHLEKKSSISVREPTRGEREERTSENDEESEKTKKNRLPIFPRLIYSPFRPSCRGAKRETKRKEIDMRIE